MFSFADHRSDPESWARALGISREAVEIYLASDVIDLHIDSFIWTRIFGYDLTRRHGRGLFNARFYSQVDLPRIREAQVSGGIWVITTNPSRSARGRTRAFFRNLDRLRKILDSASDDVTVVRTAAEYRAARAAGKHAAFLGIQGGNALDGEPDAIERIPDRLIVRVTLVHLSSSSLGATSAPGGGDAGLTEAGHDYVRRLEAQKIFVDLAHINRRGFFDALSAHDPSLPVIVTHTGVTGVKPHWRNLDDEQLKAIASTGGTVGVMYQTSFLGDGFWNGRAEWIVDHLAHIVKVAGEDFASLGSDWDGAIVTPRDLPTCLELPRLAQLMLDRGWSPERIGKILGGNWLRTLALMRG
ncbi:MAG TPA: membrane dipeptidase [Polyangia bacterium]